MPTYTFPVDATAETPTRTRVLAREFTIIVDEPPSLDGEDLGPNPVEYVLAGFAGCLNVVGHLVARDLGFTIRKLSIQISGELDPGRLKGATDGPRAGFQSITAKLDLDADITDEQKEAWLRAIEARCPVSDNLANPTPVTLAISSPAQV